MNSKGANRIGIIAVLLALFYGGLIVYATVFTNVLNTARPAGADSPTEADDNMRRIQAAIQELLNVCLYVPLTGTEISDADAGEIRKILFHEPIASPGTVAADHGVLFIKDVAGKAELFWMDEDEQEIQLTSAGDLKTTTNLVVDGTSTLTGTVTATGAVTVGTTLDVTGNIDPTTYETTNGGFLDEDDMASDAADKVISQQSSKAYADARSWQQEDTGVFATSMTAANTFQDLDLSGTIGSNTALVLLSVQLNASGGVYVAKEKGTGSAFTAYNSGAAGSGMGASSIHYEGTNKIGQVLVSANSSGVIQHGASNDSSTFTIKVIGYTR